MASKKQQLIVPVANTAATTLWGERKDKFANREVASGAQKISTANRVFSIGGKKVGDGKEFHGIILQFSNVKTYYTGTYDPGNVVPPDCFALGLDENLSPHANSASPQHDTCKTCRWNEFGSASGGRVGKACRDVRRLVLVTGQELADKKVVSLANTTLNVLDIPPTGLANWRDFYKYTLSQDLPVTAFVVKFTFDPEQPKEIVKFTPVSVIENEGMFRALLTLEAEADKIALRPWQKLDEAAAPAPQKTKVSSAPPKPKKADSAKPKKYK